MIVETKKADQQVTSKFNIRHLVKSRSLTNLKGENDES